MNPKILIVDDDPSITSIFEFILSQAGYSALTASIGSQCINMLQSQKIDLVFLDVALADATPFATLKRIIKDYPRTPVIMMSAFTTPENTLSQLFELGAYGIVYKPFDVEEVMTIISSIFKPRKAKG